MEFLKDFGQLEAVVNKISSTFLIVVNAYPLTTVMFISGLVLTVFGLGLYFTKEKEENSIALTKHEDKFNNICVSTDEVKIDIKEAVEVLHYLNELITEKFNYHLHTKLLPLYVSDKTPDISVIKEIKEHVYVSVTTSISSPMKKLILK